MHALLVGVSQYPGLGPDRQLQAPANDVRLMREVLLRRGFDAQHIEVLADGIDGAKLPTHDAIVAALQALRSRVKAGDTVYVHFVGHGSLERIAGDDTASTSSAPRWRPVFLPRDASGWDEKSGASVRNAIADTLLRSELDRINDAGAFVFGVFDACHSARLVRGGKAPDVANLRPHYVAPPGFGTDDRPPGDTPLVWSGVSSARSADAQRGGAVYFYASQSIETTQSLPLPTGNRVEWHGVFTWHIAQALALNQRMTYRQLAQHLLSRYDQLPATAASPLFSGDGLDQWVFGQDGPLVRQWPLERGDGQLAIEAGALSGLGQGALFALLADPLAPAQPDTLRPPQGTLGFVKLARLEAGRSMLEPVAWQQWAAPVPRMLSPGVWARLVVNPPGYALRVAGDSAACSARCVGSDAMARLKRDGVAGVDVRWVTSQETPDVTLRVTDDGVRLLLPGESVASAGWGYADRDGEDAAGSLARELASALHRVARSRNLLNLSARMALKPRAPGVEVTAKIARMSNPATLTIMATAKVDQITPVHVGDVVVLQGANDSADPVDVAIFWLGRDQGIRQVYPSDPRDAKRIDGHQALPRIGVKVDAGSSGFERILVLTMPFARGHEAIDFRFLEQSPLARLRGSADSDLQALMDACFADYRTRGGSTPALPPDRLQMQVYTLEATP